MSASSHEFISAMSNAGVPAMIVSFGVETCDSVVGFANGSIDGKELAYDLGEAGVKVALSAGAVGLAGAAVATVGLAGGAATLATMGASLIAGTVATVIAVEAYETAIDLATPGAEKLLDKAKSLANETYEQTPSFVCRWTMADTCLW